MNESEMVEQIAGQLTKAGYAEWAEKLDKAMYGSTGTEINMALGSTLDKFLRTRPKIERETKDLIKTLRGQINKNLRWR